MASHGESDSDSELIFEDAVDELSNSDKPIKPVANYSADKYKDMKNTNSDSIKDNEKVSKTGTAAETETSEHSVENLETQIGNMKLNDHNREQPNNQNNPENVTNIEEKSGENQGDEETESCSESDGEFDEETMDELMREATKEKQDSIESPKDKDLESSEEESEDESQKIDEEGLKERDATLTAEDKEELKDKAQEYKTEGNRLFKEGNYIASVAEYTSALQTCPLCYAKERSIMYSNRGAAKLHLEKHEAAIEDCSKAVELNPNYLKALLRRAELYEKTEKLDEALTDYTKVLEMDPGQYAAREAAMRLPDQIKERNEKMKEEMMGKLKDLGNMILKPFGLSTNNFQLQQDPNTGGYSVNFTQNAPKQ